MPLNLIQVGLGAHGRGVGAHYVMPSPDFEYAGLVEIDQAALQNFVAKNNLPDTPTFSDYRQAFAEVEADAVLVTAASPAHFDICRAALENGLHILVEKPFVLSLEHGRELVRLAGEKGKNIMVGQNYRYFPNVLTLKKAMQENLLGQPQFIQGQFYFDHDGKAYQREMDDYILLEMAIHHIDLMRFLTGSELTTVRGTTWNYPGSGYKGDPSVNAAYETGAGVRVFYTASLFAKAGNTSWEGSWRVQCERGILYLDDLGQGQAVYAVEPDQPPIKLPTIEPEREGIHAVLAEFAASIHENREPAISGRDNLRTLAAVFATSQSSKEGRTVKVEL